MERNCGNRAERGGKMSRLKFSQSGEADARLKKREWKKCKPSTLKTSRSGACVAVLGLLSMGYGAYRGEITVIMEKAINICMECIGIG